MEGHLSSKEANVGSSPTSSATLVYIAKFELLNALVRTDAATVYETVCLRFNS